MPDLRSALPGSAPQTLRARNDALERQVRERTAALRDSETALRESEVWLAAQKEAFQAAINGAPLEASLGVLVRTHPAFLTTLLCQLFQRRPALLPLMRVRTAC